MASTDKADSGIVDTIKQVFYALLIAGIFRTLFFQPFWIPSGSMKDTLLIGDFLFVNKMAYGYSQHSCPFSLCPFDGRIFGSDPEQGDVVVFRHPTNGTDYVKRLIGLPGDRVQMVEGVLHINGTAVKLEPTGRFEEIYDAQGPEQESARTATATRTVASWRGTCVKVPKFVSKSCQTACRTHHSQRRLDGGQFDDDWRCSRVPRGALPVYRRQSRQFERWPRAAV